MSTKKYLDLDGLSRVWDKIGDKFVASTYATSNLSKKISSIQSFYGTSSASSTTPTRWTLPDEYQEVEYIASDTTNKPYIDSGVVCTDIAKIECKFATLSMGSSQYITGARGQAIYIAITGSGSTTVYNATYNGTQVLSDITRANEVVVDSSVTLGEIDGNNKRTATFYCSDGTNTFTQTSSPISVIPSGATATLCLFGFHSTNNSPSRIYREKVYTDNGLVRDFIPCYIKATSEMGMYDLVTNQFYGTASNSRPFVLKGSNVTYVPQLTDAEPYLWGYDLITYTDGTTQKSPYYIVAQKSSGGSGTTDYTDLSNKPQINSVTLTGNKSLNDLGIAAANEVINATDLTISNNSVNLVDYVSTPGIYKVPSNCLIYTDSARTTSNRIAALTGDIVKIEPQIDAGDGEEIIEFDTYFTVFGSSTIAGSMITADNVTWTSSIVPYEHQGNKVTTISSSSRNTQYPSAKAVYDYAASKALYTDTTINTGRSANSTVGGWSAAIGLENIASGQCSVSEGEVCTASGEASHSGGIESAASGDMSLAYGDGAVASGEASISLGRLTIAQRRSQIATGRFNIADTTGSDGGDFGAYAEICGNGSSNSARSNARTTDWNGNGWYAGKVKVGGTGYDDPNSEYLATEGYVEQLTRDGVQKVMLYNGKTNNTAVLTGVTQALTDSIFNYDLIVVGFNCLVGSTRVMELTMPIYPKSDLIVFCDATGTGATGAYHIVNANTAFASGNAYRVMWGFTDATHIRNIISNQVGWSSPGICYVIGYKFSALPDGYMQEPATEGTSGQVLTTDGNGGRTWTTVSGSGGGTTDYTQLSNKPQINSVTLTGNVSLSTLGAATEQYVDNKITYGTSDLTAGTSPLTTGTLYFVYE